MNYALMQNAHVSVPTFRGLAGAGDIVETTQVLDGATIQFSVDSAYALGADAANTLTNTLNGSQLLRSASVGGPSVPLFSGTLNISAISNGTNDANVIIGLIKELAGYSFSFDATQARGFMQEPAPGLEILKGFPGWSPTPVIHQTPASSIPTWMIVGGVAVGAIVLLIILTR